MRWRLFSHPWLHTRNTHGTGCTLSSAIATHVAMGLPMADAVEAGIGFLCQALERGADVSIGEGHGPVNHLFDPVSMRIISN
jgi:hydroxymethylpyrimidine/phosphomethylpyrimidine kinase